jgi:uncharacterized protein (DUF1810 family)
VTTDRFNLNRFITAQDAVIDAVIRELRCGRKVTHWMWFIFPQIQGLGSSSMARHYAIASQEEARAYHGHRVLGSRLRECTQLVLDIQGRGAEQIFGHPDDLKFRSCMTLFAQVVPQEPIYRAALSKYFGAEPDQRTLQILGILPG